MIVIINRIRFSHLLHQRKNISKDLSHPQQYWSDVLTNPNIGFLAITVVSLTVRDPDYPDLSFVGNAPRQMRKAQQNIAADHTDGEEFAGIGRTGEMS